jgi:NADPH2:quinone reductase
LRAVWLREFGPPSVLTPGDAPEPSGAVIEVEFANITFVETQVRAGRGPFPVSLPMIPGNGVGGRLNGRRVVASLGGSGGYAQYAVGAEVFDVPDELPLDHAVALLADGRTAMLLMDAAAVQPGETVHPGRGRRRRLPARPALRARRRARHRLRLLRAQARARRLPRRQPKGV